MEWIIREEGFHKEKTEFFGNKFSIGNGYFGYRGTLEEYGSSQLVACTLSEIYDDNGSGWREPVNAPNGLITYVQLGDERLSPFEFTVKEHVQELELTGGIHRRRTVYLTNEGKTITVLAERFASADDIHLLALRYTIEAEENLEVVLHTGIDTDIWNINGNHFGKTEDINRNEISGVFCETIENKKRFLVAQKIRTQSQYTERKECGRMVSMTVSLQAQIPFVMEKYVSICKETDCPDLWQTAVRCCNEAEEAGFEKLMEKQKTIWAERYADIGLRLHGDPEAEKAVYYSCYLLYSSAPEHTDRVAIPARGLSGQVYKGAMFWDTEIYMLPMFAFCNPAIARNLIMYRVHNLEGAREKALEYGYRGAFYPWESQETGRDGCTLYNLTDIFTGRKLRTYFRDRQIHISADVAYGIWRYIMITQDRQILLEGAAEVILECARFFVSFAYFKKDKDRYEFLDVTGADEYHERVNNDAYTNYMIHLTAEIALEVLAYLKENEPEHYERIMKELDFDQEAVNIAELHEKIYLPQPNETGVVEQFDGYLRQEDCSIEELYARIIKPNEYLGSPCGLAVNTQIIKQADVVLLLSILNERFSSSVKQENWDYYEPRTEHGSSLSTCIYGLLAAKTGKTKEAYRMLMRAANLDLIGDYKLYLGELYIGGTHPAANGGSWLVTVQGFAGLDIFTDAVVLEPHLPEQWESMEFSFQYAQSSYHVIIDHRQVTVIPLKQIQEECRFLISGKHVTCVRGENLKVAYQETEE